MQIVQLEVSIIIIIKMPIPLCSLEESDLKDKPQKELEIEDNMLEILPHLELGELDKEFHKVIQAKGINHSLKLKIWEQVQQNILKHRERNKIFPRMS